MRNGRIKKIEQINKYNCDAKKSKKSKIKNRSVMMDGKYILENE